MDVRFLGTGGTAGWPQDGCRCASCMRARAAGGQRRPGGILIDGQLRVDPGQAPRAERRSAAHRIEAVPGGWDITGPDGGRLLVAAGPGAVPDPPAGTRPFDLLLLDLLHDPAQLGALRARGLARAAAIAAALHADHRVFSEDELARRCRLWRAVVPRDGETLSAAARPQAGGDGGDGARYPHRTLILGGARSGKSREAELRLAAEPRVTYVAAGPWPDGSWRDGAWTGPDGRPDTEWARRVTAHRASRPPWWQTIETTDVAGALAAATGGVLIDGIGTWLAAIMTEAGAWTADARPDHALPDSALPDSALPDNVPPDDARQAADGRVAARIDQLIAAWRQTRARVMAVSDQVGSGVVPATAAGRQFRDQLGWLNQRLAAESEETLLVTAGRIQSLDR